MNTPWSGSRDHTYLLFVHRTCGQLFRPEVRCSACGEEVRAPDVVVRPGPGGRAGRGTRVVARRLQERAGAA
jgi:hypothetical protein